MPPHTRSQARASTTADAKSSSSSASASKTQNRANGGIKAHANDEAEDDTGDDTKDGAIDHTNRSEIKAQGVNGKAVNKDTDNDTSQTSTDEIQRTLFHLLSRTKSNQSTICPSQIPRALHDASPARYPDWRSMMDPVREVVWEQVRLGVCEVTQGGEARAYEQREALKGPIRVRKGGEWDDALASSPSAV